MKDFKTVYREKGAYHLQASGFRAWFLEDNYKAIRRLASGRQQVLDLGCGEGCLAAYIDPPIIDGVDYSDEALKLNREFFPGRYRELFRADLTALGGLALDAAGYDCIVCSLTLMYLAGRELERCIAETVRLLREDGIFVVTYPTVGPHRQGSADAVELTPEQLRSKLAKAGYEIAAMEPICPFLPLDVVEQSGADKTRELARERYRAAAAQMTIANSYHFLIVGRKLCQQPS